MILNKNTYEETRFKITSVPRVILIISILFSVIFALAAAYSIGHIVESLQFLPILEESVAILSLIVSLVILISVLGNIIHMKSSKKITELESLLGKSDGELLESIGSNTLSLLNERRNLKSR